MLSIFVDTSGWLSIVNRTDALHGEATRIYNERFDAGWNFITHFGVMLEVGNGLSQVRFRHLAVQLKARIDASMRIEVIPLTDNLYEAGWQMYANRPDKNWGIVDCISFLLMQQHGLTEALTADQHFEQAGYIKLL